MKQHHRVVASIALVVGALAASGSAASLAASPEPSRVSSPAFVCLDDTPDCAGSLTAGEHATVHFEQPLTFTVPAGWTNNVDRYRAYSLDSAQVPDGEFLVWTRSAPMAQTPDCSPAREPGFGTSTQEWLRFLASRPDLEVTEPTTTDLGGRTLTSVQVAVKPTWTAMCDGNTSPIALLVTDTEVPPTRVKFASVDGPVYMGFVDIGGEAIVVFIDAGDGTPLADMLELAQPVIESIRFAAPAAGSAAP
jgi:hypothetical protein